MRSLPALLLLGACVLGLGCDPVESTNSSTSAPPRAVVDVTPPATDYSQAGEQGTGSVADRAPKEGDEVGVIETNHGRIVVMFFPDKAPGHVKNFKDLAAKKFYDGTTFHRVIPNFMIQGGDPDSRLADRSLHGSGGPGYTIKAEFSDVKHVPGVLSMARQPDPDTAGSQFFIMVGTKPRLDGQYSAFGKVVQGMETVGKIVALPRDENDNPLAENPAQILSIRIGKWPLK